MRKKTKLEETTDIIYVKYFEEKDLSKKERLRIFKENISNAYRHVDFEEVDKRYKDIKYVQKFGTGMKSIIMSFFFGIVAKNTIDFIKGISPVSTSQIGLLGISIGVALCSFIATIFFFVKPPGKFIKFAMEDATVYLFPYEINVIEKKLKDI